MACGHVLALDVGGTFTDVVLVDLGTGALATAKADSVPDDPSVGFFAGVDKIMAQMDVSAAEIAQLFHGSTVATNAILENKGAKTGMLVSDGFKYVLEIGRAEVPRKANLYAWVKPKRPVPPRLIQEVPERVRLDGQVTTPLSEEACRQAARRLAAFGVEAVAVLFLHSYANPAHERRASEILAEELPGVEIALSSEVLPVFREYERGMATALNAAVQPLVGRYIGRLAAGLEDRGIEAPLRVMKSNGGIFSPEQAARQSIHMALSGPAAGVRGAARVAGLAGHADLMTIDMGGTSTDVCLIRDGSPSISKDGEIGPFPLSIPIVDIHTIGAGGGSIAAVTEQGGLVVGPESAGAAPGPACYGKGGERPTVTDANLLLGRVPPQLLDGEVAIDPARAERAIETHVARPLGISAIAAARGILDIVNNNMVGALKVVSVEKGYDPRAFTLAAFGGAGPMHGGALARLLGAPRTLIPRHPGILCAIGLLAADLQYDFVRTRVQRAPNYDLGDLARTFDELLREAEARLEAEGVADGRRRYHRSADLRYARQGVEITVPWAGEGVSAASVEGVVAGFHRLHERLYTFADAEAPVEIVNLRITATGVMDEVAMPQVDAVPPGSVAPADGERLVVFDGDAPEAVPTYRREALSAGHAVPGPAIVDQLDTTTLILPGQRGEVDDWGNIFLIEAGDQA
ncbi:MAG: hydantoinase/oxoprolinase family protein [Alphaproteobacteria bacterium]|jgi:N-methylhydantoinase A|nr:hydantoinase/oxoprolinase family protein [Alphaproteobacteria bacterium]